MYESLLSTLSTLLWVKSSSFLRRQPIIMKNTWRKPRIASEFRRGRVTSCPNYEDTIL